MHSLRGLGIVFYCLAIVFSLSGSRAPKNKVKPQESFQLLYWNIQNGMWDGQEDNYTRFVDWVKGKTPDICVWCEAQPIYSSTILPQGRARALFPIGNRKSFSFFYPVSVNYVEFFLNLKNYTLYTY